MKKILFGPTMKLICHQIPDRSFFIFGKQFFLCARCTGLYASFFLSFITLIIFQEAMMSLGFSRILFILLLSLAPFLIDGITQFFGLRKSNNLLRVVTGILAGMGLAFVCSFVLIFLLEIFIN